MANEGFGNGSPTKNVYNNPGGDWNPGQGDNPIYIFVFHILGEG